MTLQGKTARQESQQRVSVEIPDMTGLRLEPLSSDPPNGHLQHRATKALSHVSSLASVLYSHAKVIPTDKATQELKPSPPTSRQPTVYVCCCISRVPDQNDVSQARHIVEIHHSGRKPSIFESIKICTTPK